jgi:hypothetical protein
LSFQRKLRRRQARDNKPYDVPVSDAFNEATLRRVANLKAGETMPTIVSTNSLGLPKISERLIELIGPRVLSGTGRANRQTLVTLAAIAWNLGSCKLRSPLEDMTQYREEFLAATKTNKDAFEILKALIERRMMLFPDDSRIIVNSSVVDDGDKCHIFAAAAGD